MTIKLMLLSSLSNTSLSYSLGSHFRIVSPPSMGLSSWVSVFRASSSGLRKGPVDGLGELDGWGPDINTDCFGDSTSGAKLGFCEI